MELVEHHIQVNEDALEPELLVQLTFKVKNQYRIPIHFSGHITLGSKRIAMLYELEANVNDKRLFARGALQEREEYEKRQFIATLTRLGIEKINDARRSNIKGDLNLNLFLFECSLESRFTEATQDVPPKKFKNVGLSEGALIEVARYRHERPIRITSSDWLVDLAPKLGLNKYQVFEIPIPPSIDSEEKIDKQVNAAIDSLKRMEKARLEGDWYRIIEDSREIWELLNKKTEILAILKEQGYNDPTIDTYSELIEALFAYGSKFRHKVANDKEKTLMQPNIVHKVDAELIYSLAFSLLNMVATKIIKGKSST